MRRIYKYPFEVTDKTYIQLPRDHSLLKVGLDASDMLCFWALVETENPLETVTIYVVGTGNPLPDESAVYYDSVSQGVFIWHIFISK